MKKSDLACSTTMASLLAGVPADAEIGSVAVFVGVKGSGVIMGAHMDSNPEKIASMISAFGEAKRSILEGIIREHGMEMMVTVMYFLASSQADAEDLGNGPADILNKYFVPKRGADE
jgi:hypothetical protein